MAKLEVNLIPQNECAIAKDDSPSITGMTTLADRIKEAMADAGITAAELARATGAKEPSVHKWIHGQTKNLKGKNLVIAAQLLNVSESWLADGVGPKPRKKEGWPFLTVSQERYDLLTQKQKEAIEEWVDTQITLYHGADKSGLSKKAS